MDGLCLVCFEPLRADSGGETNVNDADRIVSHLESAKPIATKSQIYHIMTEWGGSYSNGAGTGAGVGHGVGGTANCEPLTTAVSTASC